jgi:hypothetical protein
MKSLLALLALGLLAVAMAACGSSNHGAASSLVSSSGATSHTASVDTTSPAAAPAHVAPSTTPQPTRRQLEKYDRDEDDYQEVVDDHNPVPPGFTPADAADRQAITALVGRYYAAALSGNGARGCSMIQPSLVKAIPLDYGKLGAPYLRRAKGTCPAVMSLMFKHEHRVLAREVPDLHVVRVAVSGTQGVAILRFGLRERGITEAREGHVWKVAAVLDGELE